MNTFWKTCCTQFLFTVLFSIPGFAGNGTGPIATPTAITPEAGIARAQAFLEAQFLTSSEEEQRLRRFVRAAYLAMPLVNYLHVEVGPDRRFVEISLVEHARCASDLYSGTENPRMVGTEFGGLKYDLRPRALPFTVCTYVVFQVTWDAAEMLFEERELSVHFDRSGKILVLDLLQESYLGARYTFEGLNSEPTFVTTAALALAMRNYDEQRGVSVLPTTDSQEAYRARAREYLLTLPLFGRW